MNTDMFNDFIQDKILSECEQFSEPHSVLCMNNCRIHHSEIDLYTNISILAIANLIDRSLQLCVKRLVSFLYFFSSICQTTILSRSYLVN